MADKMREKHVAEITRLEDAIKKTKSIYLKRDCEKAIRNMRRELADYDRFKAGVKNG